MQEGQLVVLSPQDEEDRVQQLHDLGEVVEVEGRRDRHRPLEAAIQQGLLWLEL